MDGSWIYPFYSKSYAPKSMFVGICRNARLPLQFITISPTCIVPAGSFASPEQISVFPQSILPSYIFWTVSVFAALSIVKTAGNLCRSFSSFLSKITYARKRQKIPVMKNCRWNVQTAINQHIIQAYPNNFSGEGIFSSIFSNISVRVVIPPFSAIFPLSWINYSYIILSSRFSFRKEHIITNNDCLVAFSFQKQKK